jgi:hypothetical protein
MNRSTKEILIYSTAIIFMIFSCKEIYYPDVEGIDNIMVVEGLVTDQPGRSVIKLSYYHESSGMVISSRNASVHITDNLETKTSFLENDSLPGQYLPPSLFAGIPGRTYTLHITAADGYAYRSTPQKMNESARLDSVYPKHAEKQFLNLNFYGAYRETLQGTETYCDLSGNPGDILRVRIETTLVLLYVDIVDVPPPDFENYYCWRKFKLTDAPEINIQHFESGTNTIRNHPAGFMPFEKTVYKLQPTEHIHRKIVILNYYTLNMDAYNFHNAVHKQINSENQLFDPIPSQLPTNIICIDDPEKLTAGFFEASSSRSETYMLLNMPHNQLFEFVKYEDLEDIPAKGSILNNWPVWWPI